MKTIRIEVVADINFKYPYLEVFKNHENKPFLDIGISDERQLIFKSYGEFEINLEDWKYILKRANEFLPKALENEDKFSDFFGS